MLNVRLTTAIDVDASKAGQTFPSLLDDPVMLQGKQWFRGAPPCS